MKKKSKIDPSDLAAQLQKARMNNIPVTELMNQMKTKANSKAIEKKVDAGVAEGEKTPTPTAPGQIAETEDSLIVNGVPIKQGLLGKAKTFSQAVISRGLNNQKAPDATYSLRVLSCHGKEEDQLPPCPFRKNSENYPGSHYCGACGCGDKPLSQLSPYMQKDKLQEYTKLHFPRVTCPLEMPGFSNYKANIDSQKTANPRKVMIELQKTVDHIKANST